MSLWLTTMTSPSVLRSPAGSDETEPIWRGGAVRQIPCIILADRAHRRDNASRGRHGPTAQPCEAEGQCERPAAPVRTRPPRQHTGLRVRGSSEAALRRFQGGLRFVNALSGHVTSAGDWCAATGMSRSAGSAPSAWQEPAVRSQPPLPPEDAGGRAPVGGDEGGGIRDRVLHAMRGHGGAASGAPMQVQVLSVRPLGPCATWPASSGTVPPPAPAATSAGTVQQPAFAGTSQPRGDSGRPRESSGRPSRSELLNLPDVMFQRIYAELPHLVAPHTAVCRHFRDELVKMAQAHLIVRSCPNIRKQVSSMRRFQGRIKISLHDPDGRNKIARPFVDVLRGGSLDEVGFAPIGWANLLSLDFSATRLPTDCLDHLTDTLKACRGLQEISLKNNQIGAGGLRSLAPALMVLMHLRRLELGSNNLKMLGLQTLLEQMQPRRVAGLEYLDLSDNQLPLMSLQHLGATYERAADLRIPIRLKNLNLSKNSFEGAAVEQLAVGLTKCCTLTSLDLSVNRGFGAPGARHLAPILRTNTSLTHLNLKETDLYPEGMAAMAGSLAECACLKSVNLYHNAIGDKGAAHLMSIFDRSVRLPHSRAERQKGGRGASSLSRVCCCCSSCLYHVPACAHLLLVVVGV